MGEWRSGLYLSLRKALRAPSVVDSLDAEVRLSVNQEGSPRHELQSGEQNE